MGQLGNKTIEKLTTYALKHYSPKALGFSADMEIRVMIAEQLFQVYASGRVPITRSPRKVVGEIAERVYRQILTGAAADPHLAYLRDECGIKEGVKRTYIELANDIQAYEVFRAQWGVDTSNHAKAVCEEAAYTLVEMGVQQNDARALASGYDRLSKLHNDFQEKNEDFAHTADTEVEFVSDVQIVRPDAENVSREKIDEFKKKYGKFLDKKGGIETLIENEEGVFELPTINDNDNENENDDDFFVKKEREHGVNS